MILDNDIPNLRQGRIHPAYPHGEENQLKALPGKREWHTLETLKTQEGNFTLYSNQDFAKIKTAYLAQDPSLSAELRNAYRSLAGRPMLEAHGKTLRYPTLNQLQGEVLLLRFPFIECLILLYLLSVCFKRAWCFWIPLAIHSFYLLLRCYILGRPPVTNMYETLNFVPWVVAAAGLFQTRLVRAVAAFSSAALLLILLGSSLQDRLENVQAVLDSQYWLLVHVLMVVGSYGFFILSGITAHVYLFSPRDFLTKTILHCLYVGTGLLITGTILGGVWAAQSWGRFWDWDPKESWAFISCCLYLILVHLYRFQHIGAKGLAIGSIIGLQAITFTWYGVNYILGTGMHSYGFGAGGTGYYLAFLLLEAGFLASFLFEKRVFNPHQLHHEFLVVDQNRK